ncbi:hypothetical protein SLOPH_945 [Spraguea lophii 42_110]|uniref:Uncharacterized protein n=1 Tax=Spraguea lophii (strain 42_110) TaxID=1358809 RepID=S7W821_SPRLO|nr:hypothetical protein SLOPH_945 [Spraguea lophii 42_110]
MNCINIPKIVYPVYDNGVSINIILCIFAIISLCIVMTGYFGSVLLGIISLMVMAVLYFLVYKKSRTRKIYEMNDFLVVGSCILAVSVFLFFIVAKPLSSISTGYVQQLYLLLFLVDVLFTVVSGYFLYLLVAMEKNDGKVKMVKIICFVLVLLPLYYTVNGFISLLFYYILIIGGIFGVLGSKEGSATMAGSYKQMLIIACLVLVVALMFLLGVKYEVNGVVR